MKRSLWFEMVLVLAGVMVAAGAVAAQGQVASGDENPAGAPSTQSQAPAQTPPKNPADARIVHHLAADVSVALGPNWQEYDIGSVPPPMAIAFVLLATDVQPIALLPTPLASAPATVLA